MPICVTCDFEYLTLSCNARRCSQFLPSTVSVTPIFIFWVKSYSGSFFADFTDSKISSNSEKCPTSLLFAKIMKYFWPSTDSVDSQYIANLRNQQKFLNFEVFSFFSLGFLKVLLRMLESLAKLSNILGTT